MHMYCTYYCKSNISFQQSTLRNRTVLGRKPKEQFDLLFSTFFNLWPTKLYILQFWCYCYLKDVFQPDGNMLPVMTLGDFSFFVCMSINVMEQFRKLLSYKYLHLFSRLTPADCTITSSFLGPVRCSVSSFVCWTFVRSHRQCDDFS